MFIRKKGLIAGILRSKVGLLREIVKIIVNNNKIRAMTFQRVRNKNIF